MIEALEAIASKGDLAGSEVVVMDDLRKKYPERFIQSGQMDWKWFEGTIRPIKHIYLRKDKHSLSFTLQNGPIKEVGENGCQVDAIIDAARTIIGHFQESNPCRENAIVLTKLDEALLWLGKRKADREKRNVEGTSAV